MTITITEKEYDAIAFALDQIGTEVEAATDEAFIADAEKHCNSLYNIMEKYKKARYKAKEFQDVRAVVAERNCGKCLRAKDIDKMARMLLRQLKKDGRL